MQSRQAVEGKQAPGGALSPQQRHQLRRDLAALRGLLREARDLDRRAWGDPVADLNRRAFFRRRPSGPELLALARLVFWLAWKAGLRLGDRE